MHMIYSPARCPSSFGRIGPSVPEKNSTGTEKRNRGIFFVEQMRMVIRSTLSRVRSSSSERMGIDQPLLVSSFLLSSDLSPWVVFCVSCPVFSLLVLAFPWVLYSWGF
uniref:Uncharacterized protein n=1 Tax=Cannabis sativa TaxID=3483 RepID=A0A803NZA5_CANSA